MRDLFFNSTHYTLLSILLRKALEQKSQVHAILGCQALNSILPLNAFQYQVMIMMMAYRKILSILHFYFCYNLLLEEIIK